MKKKHSINITPLLLIAIENCSVDKYTPTILIVIIMIVM